jgi:hypothetical protein
VSGNRLIAGQWSAVEYENGIRLYDIRFD